MDNLNRPEYLRNTEADDSIPEESLLDTASSNQSNINSTNNTNTHPALDEPSNAALLAGLDDLSVNNAIYQVNRSDNDKSEG